MRAGLVTLPEVHPLHIHWFCKRLLRAPAVLRPGTEPWERTAGLRFVPPSVDSQPHVSL